MNNGFSSPSTDEHSTGNHRVHEEGRQNYERNNKSADWFGHSDQVVDTRPESRLRSDAARANAEKSRGSVQEDLTHSSTRNGHSHNDKPESPENFETVKVEHLNNLSEKIANLEVSQKPELKVKSAEVENHREKVQDTSNVSGNHGNTGPNPDLEQTPPLRLNLKLDGNAEKRKVKSEETKASRESKTGRLHQESSGSGWDQSPPHHRLRADGEGIARKNNTDSITDIILQNSTTTPEPKQPKVPKHVTDTYTPRKPPSPRIRPDGLLNLQKAMNHSEMSAIMHGSPVEPAPPRPSSGRKILPHMQRSELW